MQLGTRATALICLSSLLLAGACSDGDSEPGTSNAATTGGPPTAAPSAGAPSGQAAGAGAPGAAAPSVGAVPTTMPGPGNQGSTAAGNPAATTQPTANPAEGSPPASTTAQGATGEPAEGSQPAAMEGLMEEVNVDPALVDDFEDADGALLDRDGRVGQWGAYNDGTGEQMPAAGTGLTPEPMGANGSQYAAHTSGSGFSDWGAGLQVDLNNSGSRAPYDAGAYGGISFYARGSGDVRVELVTTAIATQDQGGDCMDGCYDAHGATIDIGSEWELFSIPFSSVAQEGWGTAADFDAATLLGLNFKMTKPDEDTPADFDFWLDELRFTDGSGAAPGGTDPDNPVMSEPEPEPEPVGPITEPGMCSMDIGRYDGNGSVTYYTFAMGSSEVNCSYQIVGNNPDRVDSIYTGEGRYFGAMNTTDYNNAAMCGACVEVTRDGNRSVVITVVDQCPVDTNPKCQAGHIDLSLEAFRQIAQDQEGHVGTGNGGAVGSISWRYVECPVEGQNVTFRLKEPDRMDWNELLVQAHRFPITSVEIDGNAATRKAYNYWEPPGNMGSGPWRVRVTDAVGGVVEATVSREDMNAGVQFACQ